MDRADDAALLAAWRAGERGAGEDLMRRHYGSVLRYFELNASWAADDLAQRTFMACIERAADVRDPAAFVPYLMGIARRQLALHQRDLFRNAALRGFDAPSRPTQLSTLLARNQQQLLVLRALTSLARRPQLLIVLFYWEGIRTPELAAAFGVPTSTIRTRLARARNLLRARMTTFGSEETAWAPRDDAALQQLLTSVLSSGPMSTLATAGAER